MGEEGVSYERFERKVKRLDDRGLYGTPFRFCINRKLRTYIARFCPSNLAEILDIGCGEGKVVEVLKELKIDGNYLGIDISEKQRWSSIYSNEQLKVAFRVQDAHKLSTLGRSFNFCVSITSFEHFWDDERVLEGIKRVSFPGSYLVLIVPSKYSYWLYGRHGYRRYSKKQIATLAGKYRFQTIEIVKLGGGLAFGAHFLWSSTARVLRITAKAIYYMGIVKARTFYDCADNIMHLHLNSRRGKRIHKRLQQCIFIADRKLVFLESGYMCILKNVR